MAPRHQGAVVAAPAVIGGEDRRLLGREVATRLAAAAGADAAFLAGSTAVGLGGRTSDVDVYLVGADLPATRRQLVVGQVRIDVQSLTAEALAGLVDRFAGAQESRGSVSDPDIALAVRLWTGEVVTGAGLLDPIRERLGEARLTLRRLVVNGWALSTYTAVEDLAGVWRSDDHLDLDLALLATRQALVAAGKALAAAGGDLHRGEKWVWRQLARSAPVGFPFADLRRLVRDGPPAGDPWEGLAGTVPLAQTCLAAAMTLGWHDVPLDRWPGWLDQGGPLRRADFFLPQRYGDGMSIVGPGTRVYPVPAEAALVWGLCNGSSADSVVARAVALSAAAVPFARLTDRRCRAVLGKLLDAALVVSTDQSGGYR